MGNYSEILVVSQNRPLNRDEFQWGMRYAKNIIPLFWWGAFAEIHAQTSTMVVVDSSGQESREVVSTLFADKSEALNLLKEFELGLGALETIQDRLSFVEILIDDLKSAPGEWLQLETGELEMMMDTEPFENWLQEGLNFAKLVRERQLQELDLTYGDLLSLSGIYIEAQDEACVRTRPPKLHSPGWEHSLIGVRP